MTTKVEPYTRLEEKEIVAILAQFDIHNMLSFELLTGGSENTNYFIKTESGKYVLCICEQKTTEKAKELADTLKYLEANNFNTSKVIYSHDKESVINWKGKSIMIREFLEGKVIKDLTPHLLKLVGRELAGLHQIKAPKYLPDHLSYGREHFNKVKKYAANSDFDIWLAKVNAYIEPYFNLDLPKTFIHGDVFWDNVIISEDDSTVTIMDFEESTYYYRLFDMGMTIVGVCSEVGLVNLVKARHLLIGYQSEVKLTEEEIHSLKPFTVYACAAMAFWRHQNFNYTKPDPKMFNHYMELKDLADYLLNLSDDSFKNLLN